MESTKGAAIIDATIIPAGYQQLTGMTASTPLTVPDYIVLATLQAEGQDIRYRDDGVDPTASVGMLLKKDQTFFYNGKVNQLKFIAVVSGAILNVNYYR